MSHFENESTVKVGLMPEGAQVLGGILVEATSVADKGETVNDNGYLTPEFIAKNEGNWVKRDGKKVWIACGDERATEDACAEKFTTLQPEALPINEGSLSIYGQGVGLTRNILVVGVAQHGPEFFDEVGGFEGLFEEVVHKAADDDSEEKVLLAQHSDASKEAVAGDVQEAGQFCAHGDSPLGCAYCMLTGAVGDFIAHNDEVYAVGKENIEHLTGEQDDQETAALREANRHVNERIGSEFAFGRQKYVESGLPVQILEGIPHLPAAQTGFIVNLDPRSVGKAGSVYRGDVAGVAQYARKLLPKYDLSPSMLIKSQVLEAAAVRTALSGVDVSGDTTPDARRIGFGVRGGTFKGALAEIARLERSK